jgi:quercetin dioxygenase-like cupin family protein
MADIIQLPSEIGAGKVRNVDTLFADATRKLVLISLRENAILAEHSAKVSITIQAVLGTGRLRVADRDYLLIPGTIVPVDAHVTHAVYAEPAICLLVTFFRQPDAGMGDATTARLD